MFITGSFKPKNLVMFGRFGPLNRAAKPNVASRRLLALNSGRTLIRTIKKNDLLPPNRCFISITQTRHLNMFLGEKKDNITPPQSTTTKQPKSKVLRNVLAITLLLLTLLLVLQPYNPFPSAVSKELRQGLWAERKADYLKALTHYINALSNYEQGENKVNKLSDEYTGIELKIMEMYLNLQMYKEASMVLLELCYRYYNYINDAVMSGQKVNFNTLSRLYCRDLRSIIKFVDIQLQHQNTGMNLDSIIRLLEAHLKLAESEVFMKDMDIPSNLLQDALKSQEAAAQNGGSLKVAPKFTNMVNDEVLNTDRKGFLTIDLNSNRKSFIFEPFKDEIFIAKDLLDTLYLQKNDFNKAIVNKRITLTMMAAANCEPGMLMMTQANLGTLYYMRLQQLRDEYSFFKQQPDKFREVLMDTDNFDEKYESFMKNLQENITVLIDNTKECYNGILLFSNDSKKKLRYNVKDNYIDTKIGESISLSKFGMAVLNMNIFTQDEQSDVDLHYCKRLLNDSKSLASDIGFTDILKQIDVELKLVDSLLNK